MNLSYLRDKRILILGFAREGVDTFHFLRRLFPKQVFGVADQLGAGRLTPEAKKLLKTDRNLKLHFGKNYLQKIGDYDVIIKSPGIPPKALKSHLKRGQIITSQTQIFFENCPGKIIGVTGTKGKSTTASLIYEVLKAGGLKAYLVGNIGKPVLSVLFRAKPSDIYVYELSSHQLMGLKQSPRVAVFLNFYPEHLDYYKNLNEYLRAKQNICRWQGRGDYFLFNPENKCVRESSGLTKAKKIALNPKKAAEFLEEHGRGLAKLEGGFYFLNMAAAIEAGRIFGVPNEKITQAIRDFKPLAHRLELVGQFKGIKFYNDSLATIPEATIAALDALGDDVQTILLGGFDRGLDFRHLARRIIGSRIKTLIFFPTTGKRIWKEIARLPGAKTRFLNRFFVVNMMKAVELAFKHTEKGKICLLSSASPSFGLFKDYADRGNQFKSSVKELGKKDAGL